MIFCFSATGNSLYAAQRISDATNDRIVSIGRALRNEEFEYDITNDEYLGFVLPTYAWTLPGAAAAFIERLILKGFSGQYVYGVFTCGESTGSEPAALFTMLRSKGIPLSATYDVVMPDNFIVWSEVPPPRKIEQMLNDAKTHLDGITASIIRKTPRKPDTAPPKDLYMKMEEVSTKSGTSKLHADGKCNSCGLCAEACPMRCIRLDASGRPYWEGSCTMCFACLHRCPANAVQYGNETQNKGRYINPEVDLNRF